MDETLWRAWLTFTEEAAKGAEQARRQFEEFMGRGGEPDTVARWLAQWAPKGMAGGAGADDLSEVIERWWDALGVVPKARFEELQTQNQRLTQRLEEAHAKIAELRRLMIDEATTQTREAAQAVLGDWEMTTREALDAQAQWARTWAEGWFGSNPGDKKDEP